MEHPPNESETIPESQSETTTEQPTVPVYVKSPRPLWIEAFFHTITFGVYTPFWMVYRISELKKITGKNFTTWLWFFAPLVALALPFAFYAYTSELKTLANQLNIKTRHRYYPLWIWIVFLLSILVSIQEFMAWPGWTLILFLLLRGLSFAWLQSDINKLYKEHGNVTFKKTYANLSIPEWVVAVFITPIFLLGFYWTAVDPFFVQKNVIATYGTGSSYSDPQNRFVINFDNDWQEVEKGTISNGYSDAEFVGFSRDMYAIVFVYYDQTLDTVSYSRLTEQKMLTNSRNCTQIKTLENNKLTPIVRTECKGSYFGDPTLSISKSIKVNNLVIEIVAYLTATDGIYRANENAIYSIVEGFSPL